MVIVKISDKSTYLLHGGKLVTLTANDKRASQVEVLQVTDATWTKMVTAFGAAT